MRTRFMLYSSFPMYFMTVFIVEGNVRASDFEPDKLPKINKKPNIPQQNKRMCFGVLLVFNVTLFVLDIGSVSPYHCFH